MNHKLRHAFAGLAIAAALAFAAPPAPAATSNNTYNLQSWVVPSNDTGDIGATLATACSQIGSGSLYVPAGTYRIATSRTIPAGVRLLPEPGAKFHITSGHTLTVNSPLEVGPRQIFMFDDLGTAPVIFGKGSATATPQLFGATEDGSTDDTLPCQAVINSLATNGGMVLFPPGTYRTTAALTMADNVVLQGQDGAKILLDYNASAGYGLIGSGTYATPIALGADAAAGAKTITATNTFSAGDIVEVASTHRSSNWPVEVMTVASSAGSTVTFTTPLRVAYTVADSATVEKLTTKNFTVRNLTMEEASGRDILNMFYAQYCKDVRVENCRFLSHRASTTPTSAVGVHIFDAIRATVTGNRLTSSYTSTGTEGISITNCSSEIVSDNHIDGYSFGIGVDNTAGAVVTGNVVNGETIGGRGIKARGCQFAAITGNTVSNCGFSGVRLQDSGRCAITGNTISHIGVGASGDSAINVSSIVSSVEETGRHTICGNVVANCTCVGIACSSTDPGSIISGNLVTDTQYIGIDAIVTPNMRIANNTIVNWGLGYTGSVSTYQGMRFHETSQVVNNQAYRTDGMSPSPPGFASAFTAIAVGDGTMFVGNVCTAAGWSDTIGHDKISQNYGNLILNYGQKVLRGTAAPTAGTFEVNDKVINSAGAAGSPSGWICVTAGTPGTWKELAPISL